MQIEQPNELSNFNHPPHRTMETKMKLSLTTLAFVIALAPAALADSYSPYNPAGANTNDPGSAPLMRDVAPRVFTRDAAALANTADPGEAPFAKDPVIKYRGQPHDPAALADTADPDSVHVFRSRR
jgi:hypothetical protein